MYYTTFFYFKHVILRECPFPCFTGWWFILQYISPLPSIGELSSLTTHPSHHHIGHTHTPVTPHFNQTGLSCDTNEAWCYVQMFFTTPAKIPKSYRFKLLRAYFYLGNIINELWNTKTSFLVSNSIYYQCNRYLREAAALLIVLHSRLS